MAARITKFLWQGFHHLLALLVMAMLLQPTKAEDLTALARLDAAQSTISADGSDLVLDLALSQPVPWRVRLLDNPPRLLLDLREVDWRGIKSVKLPKAMTAGARAGTLRPGWSRLVIELAGPMTLAQTEMRTDEGSARLQLRLEPATEADFAAAAGLPDPPDWALPAAATLPAPKTPGTGPMVVVLDPGHGGIDPGAERDGYSEAALMLTFARELKEVLLRDGRFQVVMTRDEDVFVPLESRLSIAREVGADVFLSLHADALAEGEATGATLYTLSDDASDAAAEALAERHSRDDLLSGLDLSQQDDVVATVLMDMARTTTAPRTDRLADALVAAIKAAGIKMHRHPRQFAAFSVLKAPDVPSILIELGFLSSAKDLKHLQDDEWRNSMAEALRDGLIAWSDADKALRAESGG